MVFDPQAYLETLSTVADEDIDLAKAALSLGVLRQPDVKLERYFNHLKKLCDETSARFALLREEGAPDDAASALAALKDTIADKHGYSGDQKQYDDIENASLIRAIDRGKAMPITLCILYIHVGRAQGWSVDGLDIPGHFLCRIDHGGQRLIFDPFHQCATLGAPDLRALLKKEKGEHVELSAQYYDPTPFRRILIRLENNIKFRQIESEDYAGALATVRQMQMLDPGEYRLLLDAGVLCARTDQVSAAIEALESYIKLAPHERDRHDAAMLLQQLRENLQ